MLDVLYTNQWNSPYVIGSEGNLQLSQDLSGLRDTSLKLNMKGDHKNQYKIFVFLHIINEESQTKEFSLLLLYYYTHANSIWDGTCAKEVGSKCQCRCRST